MLIDSKQYEGSCACGQTHRMDTRLVVVEPGCLEQAGDWIQKAGLSGKSTAVYDANTYAAQGLVRPAADQEIILNPEGLHATEHAVEEVMGKLDKPDYLLAVGAGTIHDTVRYCAAQLGVPFVSVPTAASVDGFCSTVCAMTWHGYKKTMPGVAPVLVLADTKVIAGAPYHLAVSGVGDILGKFTSLVDWKIASLLTGEHYCERVAELTMQATLGVWDSCAGLATGDGDAYEQLIAGLVLSGLAMQMVGNSRPASGAEHHISHLLELELPGYPKCGTLHGERVGVGSILISETYHRLAQHPVISGRVRPYEKLTEEAVRPVYAHLTEEVLAENEPDSLAGVDPTVLADRWAEVRGILSDLPTPQELCQRFEGIGGKVTLEDIGVDPQLRPSILRCAPLIRNRLTLLRIQRLLDGALMEEVLE